VEVGDQRHACEDEDPAGDDRPDDAPEEDPVMVLGRHAEVGEQRQEHEEVVDRERLLDEERGQVGERLVMPPRPADEEGERQPDAHPDDAPQQGLPRALAVGMAMEHQQVEGQ
jgi:hypothetical protein